MSAHTPGRVEEIRRLNARKKEGHTDSAVQHCRELLDILDAERSVKTDLLASAQRSLEVAKSWHDHHGSVECDLLCGTIPQLEAALAKAAGQPPAEVSHGAR